METQPSGKKMFSRRLSSLAMITVIVGVMAQNAPAGDLKITLPKRSQLTPVQRLNREGVDAIRKQQYEKAETLFFKAYLFDPADPFTLYNLGYVSTLGVQSTRKESHHDYQRTYTR